MWRRGAGRWRLAVAVLLVVTACAGDDGESGPAAAPTTSSIAPTTTPSPTGLVEAACGGDLRREEPVVVGARQLVEASGLAASRSQGGVLWAHNDSGDGPRVFAVADDGRRLGTFRLGTTADGVDTGAVDWEDMALGPGGAGGGDALYIGDIGDNAAGRDHVTIYRVPEPEVPTGGEPVLETLDGVEAIEVTYPDGPRDAEALLVDPASESFVIIEKSLAGGPVGVYSGPLDWPESDGFTVLERIGTYDAARAPTAAVTAADLSADGMTLAVRAYGHVYLWSRDADAGIADVLATEPCDGPLPSELQGEAIGLLAGGAGYVTLPESVAGSPVLLSTFVPRA